jgi:hypothetical protein
LNDDRKDAGEMGAGHTVTVLYEIVPAGIESAERSTVDPLKYQASSPRPPATPAVTSNEWLTVKVRYKAPDGDTSELLTHAVTNTGRVQYLPFASTLAEFGLLLRDGGDAHRWAMLSRRVANLHVPAGLTADKMSFAELVDIAAGLNRAAR